MIDSIYKGKFGKEVEALPPLLDFIKISQSHYALSRTPTNSELTEGLGIGDVVSNGMLTDDILITRARWANTLGDEDYTNFGSYANKYKDGNYTNVTFTKF